MSLQTVQVSFFRDPARRAPDALLQAWPTLTDVADAVAAAGVRVDVVQAAERDVVIHRGDVTYHFVRDPALPNPLGRQRFVFPLKAVRHCRELSPDVIHVHGLGFPLSTRLLRFVARDTPVVVQDHGGAVPAGMRRVAATVGHRGLRAAIFTARGQEEPYEAAGIFGPDTTIFAVPEASTHFRPGDRAAARRKLGVHGEPCVAWVGRLNRNKDPLTVLAAFGEIAQELPGAHLWCCYTEGPLLQEVERRIASSTVLRHRAHLMGSLEPTRVELLLQASDFLMLGSHREGSGYAVLEALACGVTPIVTDIPSFVRFTDGGRVGSTTPTSDARTMAKALVRWWERPREERRRLALSHFERDLSFSAVGRQLREVYETLTRSS